MPTTASPPPRSHRAAAARVIAVVAHRDDASLARWADVLRAELRPGDHVVIRTTDVAAARRSAKALPNARYADPHGPLLSGTIMAPDCSVLLVHGDAIPARRGWLADLLAVTSTPGVGAAGPLTNAVPWPACLSDGPDASARRVDIRAAFGPPSPGPPTAPLTVRTLSGPAVLLCSAGVAALRGTESTAEEALQSVGDAGLALVRSRGSYLHTTTGVPFLSACLIVKDEEADLAACLATVGAVADEVIVYDTGSVDGSIDLARAAGAVVIEGEWRNDFAWARNQALAAARGTWVLSIDADERLELDHGVAPELRALLGDDPAVDRFVIPLFDLQGSVHAPARASTGTPMARLFRRRRVNWVGALHEQPEARPGQAALRNLHLPGVRFLHHGYLDEVVATKGKWQRNLRVATHGLTQVPGTDKECFDLGRSLRSVGEAARAYTLFERAADMAQNVVITRASLEFAVITLAENGRADEAGPLLDRLEALPGGEGPARYLRGWSFVHVQRWAEAMECFRDLTSYDDNFTGFRAEVLDVGRAMAQRGMGQTDAAAESAADALTKNPQATEAWALLLDCCAPGASPERRVAGVVGADRLVPLFASLTTFPLSARRRIAEALWAARPGDATLLAVASQFAASVEEDDVVTWAKRLRAHGLATLCPTADIAQDGTRTVVERSRILARVAHAHGSDAALLGRLEHLAGLLHDHELAEILDAALTDFPGAAASMLVAGATTPGRCLADMGTLVAHGHLTEATAVLAHGIALDVESMLRSWRADGHLYSSLTATARRERPELAPLLDRAA